ncbi:hypothetical protein [Gymnodinialimonas hymeniacidonis]|uniref:hypothetical protein n=1 Tax=Gymnodinialimonas hymeniacidonis TaxID=3126508 RepID=UPI0034C5D9D0
MARYYSTYKITIAGVAEKVAGFIYSVSVLIPWSLLATIGNSRIARLSILVPVVGYLIVMSDVLSSIFSGGNTLENEATTFLDSLSRIRMELFYLGSLAFALGSIVFAVFAPKTAKRSPTAEQYSALDENVMSNHQTRLRFHSIVNSYTQGEWPHHLWPRVNSPFDSDSGMYGRRYTDDEVRHLYSIIASILDGLYLGGAKTEVLAKYNRRSDYPEQKELRNLDRNKELTNTAAIHLLLFPSSYPALSHSVDQALDSFTADIAALYYKFEDRTAFGARMICVVCFATGLITMAVPTIHTAATAFANVVGAFS